MPLPTPFHARTAASCRSAQWRNWSGYMSVISYGHTHDYEYFAIRNSAGLIDVTPLFKYEINGPDAANLIDRIITRNAHACRIGQVLYTPWCDDAGKMIDDGTVQRLGEQRFRMTSARPALRWFQDCGYGMEVQIEDLSASVAALSLQGPNAREILRQVFSGADLDKLKFFYLAEGEIGGFPVILTRTGYTGDLGYEIWVANAHAESLWDILMEAGRGYGIAPAGLDAMDIARIEAGLLLTDVDYISAEKALISSRKSSPFEAGLGWAVNLNKPRFVGRPALAKEKAAGSPWRFVGLEVSWKDIERLYAAVDLPPQVAGKASRVAVPLYAGKRQVGQATSSTFSPLLKKFIALATVEQKYADPGMVLDYEITVEFTRKRAEAAVVKLPFFNPERKRA